MLTNERDKARADALAWAIDAGRMRRELERAWKALDTMGRQLGHNDCDGNPNCDICATERALAPAAPGDVSVREWLEAFAETMWKDGHKAGALEHFDSPLPSRLFKQVDAALSSAPSPSPSSRLRVDALLACEKAVRAREEYCHGWDGRRAGEVESTHAAAVAALAACDKEDAK